MLSYMDSELIIGSCISCTHQLFFLPKNGPALLQILTHSYGLVMFVVSTDFTSILPSHLENHIDLYCVDNVVMSIFETLLM